MNELCDFVQQHEASFRNALNKGIKFPVDLPSDIVSYVRWQAIKEIFSEDISADHLFERLDWVESLIQQGQPWSHDEEASHFREMESMPRRRIEKACELLAGILPDAERQVLMRAMISMARNQEFQRKLFWIEGHYEDNDGQPGSFLVESEDGPSALSVVNDYCDQLGDGAAPITGAPDSFTFVPTNWKGALELLEAIADMQYPVLSKEIIRED